METKGWKSFWTALWVTLLVLLPLVAGTLVLAQRQALQRVRASESQSGVPVRLPREENHLTLLACVAGEDPAFVLLYLNADQNCIHLLALPSQLAVPFSDGEATLAQCYQAAGPARCLQGLGQVLSLPEDAHYLAATPETLAELCGGYGSLRVGFSGALTPSQLEQTGQSGVSDWTVSSAHAFLAGLEGRFASRHGGRRQGCCMGRLFPAEPRCPARRSAPGPAGCQRLPAHRSDSRGSADSGGHPGTSGQRRGRLGKRGPCRDSTARAPAFTPWTRRRRPH